MSIFSALQVYPRGPSSTLIQWGYAVGSTIPAGPYVLDVQYSRDGGPDSGDWRTIETLDPYDLNTVSYLDANPRVWSVTDQYWYRVILSTGDGSFTSPAEPAWGSPDRNDRLKMREMYRQECLRLVKLVGSKGRLHRRRNWGTVAAGEGDPEGSAKIVDPDTGDVLDPANVPGVGTAIMGGYYPSVEWWLELKPSSPRTLVKGELGTTDTFNIIGTGAAFPQPHSNDLWEDCTTGKIYRIETVAPKTAIRHIPVVVDVVLREIPYG